MQGAFAYLIAIVVIVIALNFIMLRKRLSRDRYRKPDKAAMEEEKAAVLREHEINRRLAREQEDAAEFIERRNKTLELYDQVRRNAAIREAEDAKNNFSVKVEETEEPEGTT